MGEQLVLTEYIAPCRKDVQVNLHDIHTEPPVVLESGDKMIQGFGINIATTNWIIIKTNTCRNVMTHE